MAVFCVAGPMLSSQSCLLGWFSFSSSQKLLPSTVSLLVSSFLLEPGSRGRSNIDLEEAARPFVTRKSFCHFQFIISTKMNNCCCTVRFILRTWLWLLESLLINSISCILMLWRFYISVTWDAAIKLPCCLGLEYKLRWYYFDLLLVNSAGVQKNIIFVSPLPCCKFLRFSWCL